MLKQSFYKLLLLGGFYSILVPSSAQVKFSGSLNLGADFNFPNDTTSTHTYHLGFTPQLKMKDWTLRTSIFLHGNEDDYSDFSPSYLLDYRSNLNIRLRHKKTFDLQIGRITPKVGGILRSNVPVFGSVITISPKKWIFSLSYGLGEPAVEQDSLANIESRFLRSCYAIQLKYGEARKSFLGFNVLYAKDDESSIQSQGQLSPKSSFVTGLDWNLALTKSLYTKAEWAYSFFTNDLLMGKDEVDVETNAFVLNGSTSLGYAGNLGIGIRNKLFQLEIGSEYFSPTYKSLGTSFQQADYLDVKMSGNIRLWKKRIYSSMSNGVRVNQIVSNRLLGTKSLRLIHNFSVQIRPSQKISISANYSNYVNRLEDDSIRYYHDIYQNEIDTTYNSLMNSASNNFSITPQVSFGKKKIHAIWGTYNMARNNNLSTGTPTNVNISSNFFLGYSFRIRKLSVGADAGYLSVSIDDSREENNYHLRPWVKLVLFKRKLRLNASLRAESNLVKKIDDFHLKVGFGLQYKPIKKVRLKVDIHHYYDRIIPARKKDAEQSLRFRTSINIIL